MTSDLTNFTSGLYQGTYVASASSVRTGSAYNVFDYNNDTFWQVDPYPSSTITNVSGTNYNGEWVQLSLPYSILLSSYSIINTGMVGSNYPIQWVIAGSNNGTTWFLIDSQTSNTKQIYPVTSVNYYSYYRFVYIASNGAYPALSTFNLVGSPILFRSIAGTTNIGGNLIALNNIYINDGLAVRQYAISGYVSTDANNRNVLITDNSVTLVSIKYKTLTAQSILNGAFIGVDSPGNYLPASITDISANEFSVIYQIFPGNTKSVTINFRKNGSVIDIYQSAATYWSGQLYQYTPTGADTTTAGSGGYGLIYFRIFI